MMLYLMGQNRTISYQGCACQLFFYHFLGGAECFLYTVMAYDHFVAICHPLKILGHHELQTVHWLDSGPLAGGAGAELSSKFSSSGSPTVAPMRWTIFFCDILMVLPLASTDTSLAQMGKATPSLTGDVTANSSFTTFWAALYFLYAEMAYDCCAVICHPLPHSVIMSHWVCVDVTLGAWLGSCLHASVLTDIIFRLPYCSPKDVDSFFCDILMVLPLACTDTSLAQTVSFISVGVVTLLCFLLILASSTGIVISVLKIGSSEGRHRAFTCSAHLTSSCSSMDQWSSFISNQSPVLGWTLWFKF
ncbi:Olfactory receptor 958 [Tupaia chinensis]|uniref:Olfactory receptor 958 n=1 Tax=Tupaia chinensis TaxID=246437 RepID=L9JA23_TUPCH|nr:Olfactory receptor 958 [Tupaia chinensis]